MELHKLKMDDIRGFDAAKLKETAAEIRRELLNARMDIYTAKSHHAGKVRGLRRTLARLLTVKGQTVKPVAKAKVSATKKAK